MKPTYIVVKCSKSTPVISPTGLTTSKTGLKTLKKTKDTNVAITVNAASTALTSLSVDGTTNALSVTGAPKLTSLATTGEITDFTVANTSTMTTIDFGQIISDATITIVDVYGKLIEKHELKNTDKYIVKGTDKASGVYFMEIEINQETGYSKGSIFLNDIKPGEKIAIIDDVLSTGGTIR